MPEKLTNHVEVTEADINSELWSSFVFNELNRQASNHSGKRGRFESLDWNPRNDYDNIDGYPGQILSDVCIEPITTPGLESFIEAAGEEFLDGFSSIVDKFYQNKPLLDDINKTLDYGENVAVITNHGEIYDIAIILTALRVALAKNANDNKEEPIETNRFNLIVHRMISQLGVASKEDSETIAPALGILQLLRETYLSFPRTENAKKAHIPAELVKKCNDLMLDKLNEKMSGGGQILAFAPSGSKDESIRDRLGRMLHVIKPVNAGTYRLMQAPNTKILAVGVALNSKDGPRCSMSELTTCSNDKDCEDLLETIAKRHTSLTGIITHYAHSQEDLELFRKDADEPKPNIQIAEPPTNDEIDKLKTIGLIALGAISGIAIGKYLLDRKYK